MTLYGTILDTTTCETCGKSVNRVRQGQRFCSERCRNTATKRRARRRIPHCHRFDRLSRRTGGPEAVSSAHGANPDGSTPGALQGEAIPSCRTV